MWIKFSSFNGPVLVNMDRVETVMPFRDTYTKLTFRTEADAHILVDVPYEEVTRAIEKYVTQMKKGE